MATFQSPTYLRPYNNNAYFQQRRIYTYNTTSGSPLYIHFKTNIGGASNYAMYMIEAVGYNYGLASPIRCAWGFYLYSPAGAYATGSIIRIGLKNQYGGLNADGVYLSSDYYVCIRAYAASNYYNGFTLNAYATRTDVQSQNVTIQSVIQTSNSGNYY
jgi:hypothetical protein